MTIVRLLREGGSPRWGTKEKRCSQKKGGKKKNQIVFVCGAMAAMTAFVLGLVIIIIILIFKKKK